ncbi:putative transposase, partial [Escherichia coli 95.0943]
IMFINSSNMSPSEC